MDSDQKHKRYLAPKYCSEQDWSWLFQLLEEVDHFKGKSYGEFQESLSNHSAKERSRGLYHYAKKVLNKALVFAPIKSPSPQAIRAEVFSLSQKHKLSYISEAPPEAPKSINLFGKTARATILRTAAISLSQACSLELDSQIIEKNFYADIPSERIIVSVEAGLTPQTFALKINESIVKSLLFRSTEVVLKFLGNARPIIRQAKLKGLLCSITQSSQNDESFTTVSISGPLAIFRKTAVYGKNLAELLPFLRNCQRFTLAIILADKSDNDRFVIRSLDPIFYTFMVPACDSLVESKFAKGFAKHALDWDLIREPKPIEAGNIYGKSYIYPDFGLISRFDSTNLWLLEIIGFWTPEYLNKKIETLNRAKVKKMILCINAKLNCTEADFSDEYNIIWYTGSIDIKKVLHFLNGSVAG